MKKLIIIVLTLFFLVGCDNVSQEKENAQNKNIVEDKLETSEEAFSPNVVNTNNNESNNKEESILENKDNSLSEEEDIVSYFKQVDQDIDTYLSNSENTSLSEKIKNSLITCIDFLFYEKPINGVYFNELTDKTKTTLQNMMLAMDEKIEQRFPNYKKYWEEKYKIVKDKVKEYLNKTDLYLEEKIGEDSYQEYKDTVSKVWDITKDVGNEIIEDGKNIWSNIKSWYEEETNKN